MRRHSLWSRAFAAVIAPWFAIVMAEPAALHTCAVHSGAAVAVTGAGPNAGGHSQAAHHSARQAAQVPASNAPSHGGHQCTCPGGCCPASTVSINASAAMTWVPATVRHERPLAATEQIRSSADEFLLPFANGPPSRV